MLESFLEWLEKREELSWKAVIYYISFALFLSLVYEFVLLYPFQYFFSDLRHFSDFWGRTPSFFITRTFLVFFFIALFEEAVYRVLPLGLTHYVLRGIKRSSAMLLLFGLASSAWYASSHTYLLGKGAYTVFLPISMIWSVLVTKIFYSTNRYKYLLALGASTTSHALFNVICYPFIYTLIFNRSF